MKKKMNLFLCILLILAVAACGKKDDAASRISANTSSVGDLLASASSEPEEENGAYEVKTEDESDTASEPAEEKEDQGASADSDVDTNADADVDVDLTVLSKTMVYSEVYNIVTTPWDYVGKTIKMEGLYSHLVDEATGNVYHACIIQDATACCASGIEFVPESESEYPEGGLNDGDMIGVVGTFDTYEENGQLYCTLRNAKLY